MVHKTHIMFNSSAFRAIFPVVYSSRLNYPYRRNQLANDRARFEDALKRGHSYSWDQRWQDAIDEFEQAIEAVADEPAPYAGLGMAYFELGEFNKALENYKTAARFSRGDMIYLKHVADVQERLGLLTEAGQTYMALGEIQLRRKKLDEAVGNWLRAVSLDPNLLGGHQRLAAVYRRQGLVSSAVREYLAMARIYHTRGESERALKMCSLALELDPRNPDALTAVDLIRRGEKVVFEEAKKSASGKQELTDTADIVQQMTKVLETESGAWSPDEVIDGGILGSALHMAQRQLAQEIFSDENNENLLADSGGSLSKLERDALVSQALDFQTRGMIDEAIDCFHRAIAGGLNSAAAHYCLGSLYQEKKQIKQAFGQFRVALKDLTYRPASFYAVGEAFQATGDTGKSVEYYLSALKYVDLNTVKPENAWRVNEQYDYFADSLISTPDPSKAMVFVSGITEFLGKPGWEDRVKEARRRLDNLTSEDESMILGEILTAGSLQVLESLYLSQEYAAQGKFDSAVEESYRAIQLSPHYLAGHIQLADLMAKQERTQIAVAKYLTIGDTYRVRGDINGAISNYERAVELAPMNLANRARLVEVLVKQGRIDRALEHYMIMGEAYYNLAEMEKARETYLEALRLAPRASADKNWRSRLLRAIADIDMQRLDWKRALAAYNELSASDPHDESVALTLVDLFYKVGQPGSALRQLDRYLVSLVRSEQGTKVEGILKELMERRPADAGLADRLTRLYIHQGRKEEAIKVLDALGEAQLDANQNEQAFETIQKILALNPSNAAGYHQLLQRLQQGAD